MRDVRTGDPASMAELLGEARYVMPSAPHFDGAELGREGQTIADIQWEQAEAKRRAGETAQAGMMDRAAMQFEANIA